MDAKAAQELADSVAEETLKVGWLLRRTAKSRRLGCLNYWKRRQFVILDKYLVVMSSLNKSEKYRLHLGGARVLRDEKDLCKFTVVLRAVQSSVTPPEPFEITGRRFYFKASSEEDAESWCDVIRNQAMQHAVNFARSHVSMSFRPGVLFGMSAQSHENTALERRPSALQPQQSSGVWVGVVMKGDMHEVFVPETIPLDVFCHNFFRDHSLPSSLLKIFEQQLRIVMVDAHRSDIEDEDNDYEAWEVVEGQVQDDMKNTADMSIGAVRFSAGFL